MQVDQLIGGIVGIILGVLVICNRKTMANLALNSQKQQDQFFGKHAEDYSKFRYGSLPKIVVTIIGAGLILIGTLIVLAQVIR